MWLSLRSSSWCPGDTGKRGRYVGTSRRIRRHLWAAAESPRSGQSAVHAHGGSVVSPRRSREGPAGPPSYEMAVLPVRVPSQRNDLSSVVGVGHDRRGGQPGKEPIKEDLPAHADIVVANGGRRDVVRDHRLVDVQKDKRQQQENEHQRNPQSVLRCTDCEGQRKQGPNNPKGQKVVRTKRESVFRDDRQHREQRDPERAVTYEGRASKNVATSKGDDYRDALGGASEYEGHSKNGEESHTEVPRIGPTGDHRGHPESHQSNYGRICPTTTVRGCHATAAHVELVVKTCSSGHRPRRPLPTLDEAGRAPRPSESFRERFRAGVGVGALCPRTGPS